MRFLYFQLSITIFAAVALASSSLALGGNAAVKGGAVGDLVQEISQPSELASALGQRDTQEAIQVGKQALDYAKSLYPGLNDLSDSPDGRGAKPAALTPKDVRRADTNSTNISGDDDNRGMCSIGQVSCCNQQITNADQKKQLAGLAGINDLVGTIGLSCQQLPIGILPIAVANYCKSTPLCCSKVSQNGLINFGCISLPLN